MNIVMLIVTVLIHLCLFNLTGAFNCVCLRQHCSQDGPYQCCFGKHNNFSISITFSINDNFILVLVLV